VNKILRAVGMLAAALIAFCSVEALRQKAVSREPTAEEVQRTVDDIGERAAREHPELAITDGMKQVAATDAAKKLASQTPRKQASTAADMFWGFDYTNAKARVDYCAARGVDLSPFVAAFNKTHSDELVKARRIYAAEGVDALDYLPKLMPVLKGMVEQDMRDVTTGAQVPLEQACAFFNDNAAKLAELIQMPPQVKQALMAN